MNVNIVFIILVVLAFATAIAQIIMKYAASVYSINKNMLEPSFLILLIAGLSLALFVQLTWVWALQYIHLSKGYAVMSFTFVIIPIVSWLVFKEPFGISVIMGSIFIVVGILIIVFS